MADVEKVARAIDPGAFSYTADVDGSLASILRRDQAMKAAERALAALAAAEAGEPVAWSYELATTRESDGTCGGWKPHVARTQPCVPPDAIRNLTPLYASPPSEAVEEAVKAERERCAKIADYGMLVPPDGGSPTQGECDVAARIATAIRSRGET